MAKYASYKNNSLFLLCFNEENKNYIQNFYKGIFSFIEVSDEDFNKLKYNSHSYSINNSSLIIGDYLFENDDSIVEEGKAPWFTPKQIQDGLNELIKNISYSLSNNKGDIKLPSEWNNILLDLKNINLNSITQPVRASNWVNALEKSIPNTVIRGVKEL